MFKNAIKTSKTKITYSYFCRLKDGVNINEMHPSTAEQRT
jgi:hypothetical protein